MTHGRVIVVGSLNADLTVRTQRFPRPGETLPGSELVTAPGENTIIVSPGANATLTPQDIGPTLFTDAVVVCLCLEIPWTPSWPGATPARRWC